MTLCIESPISYPSRLTLYQLSHCTGAPCMLVEKAVGRLGHTGKFIRRFGGIYIYCLIDRKW